MSSHVYFTRIEHLYSYVNARPLFEIFGDGLVEVDSSTIGPHGTITIAGGQGQDGLEDGKYCIFSITDNEFSNLEQAQNGPRIRAREFMTKIRTVDNSQIREVVRIPDSYAIENYNTWNSDVINRVQPPMSKIVYLFNNEMVYGPFKYQLKDSQGYVFSPYAAIVGNSDPNIIKCYKEDELKSNKALFGIYDNQTERIVYGEYSRYILFLKSLPDNYTEIDCITDDSLKDLVSNFLSTEGMTKAERKDLKESIKALPKECISEKRRSRILQLAENGELAEIAIKMIPTVLSSDSETLNIILSRVFSNKDYVTKLYPFIREQEGFTDLLNRLDAERNTREHELESLKAQIEDAKNGQNENLNVSSEEIERLQISLQEKEREIEQYKKKSELARELSEMEEEKDRLDILRVEVNNQANKAKNALSKKFELCTISSKSN